MVILNGFLCALTGRKNDLKWNMNQKLSLHSQVKIKKTIKRRVQCIGILKHNNVRQLQLFVNKIVTPGRIENNLECR